MKVKRPVSQSMEGHKEDIVVICTRADTPIFTVC